MNRMLSSRVFVVASILILMFSSLQSKCQIVDSESTIREIKKNVYEFLIKEEGLEKKEKLEDYENRTYITELLNQTVLGYDKTGIYVFGVFTSHTKKYLLLKNGTTYKILDPEDLSSTLHEMTGFFIEEKTSNDKMLAYVEAVIGIYKMNENRNPENLK